MSKRTVAFLDEHKDVVAQVTVMNARNYKHAIELAKQALQAHWQEDDKTFALGLSNYTITFVENPIVITFKHER